MTEFPITNVDDLDAIESFLLTWIEYYQERTKGHTYTNYIRDKVPTLNGSAIFDGVARPAYREDWQEVDNIKQGYKDKADLLHELYLHVKQEQLVESNEFIEALTAGVS